MEEEKCFLTFTCALDGDLLISLLPSLVQSRWSAAEELDDGGSELVVELEDAAVPGVGVDAQLRALDAPVQVLGESRRHHPVVVAVGDEGGLGDLRQIVRRAASPLLDRLQLRPERLHLYRGVTIDGAFLEPVDERARGGLDGGGDLAGGGADTAVVEGDDVVVLRDGVDDARIPVVQRRGQVDEEDHRDAALRTEFTVREGNAVGGEGTPRG